MHSRLKIRIAPDLGAVSPQVAFVCVNSNIKTIEDLSTHICTVFDIRRPVSLHIEKTFLPPRETIHVIFPTDIVDVKLESPEPETGSEAADKRRKSFNDRGASVEEEVPPPKRKKVKRAKESGLETLPHCHLSAEPDSPPTTDRHASVEEEERPPKKKKLKKAKELGSFETLSQHCHLSAEPGSPPTTDRHVSVEEEEPPPKKKKLKKEKELGSFESLSQHFHQSAEPGSPPTTEGCVDDSWTAVKKKRKRKHKKRSSKTADPNWTPSQDQPTTPLYGYLKGQIASSTWREETAEQLEDETAEQLDETAEQLDEAAEQLGETAEQVDETAEQLGETADDCYSGIMTQHQVTTAITGTSRNQSLSSPPTIDRKSDGDSERRVRRKRVRKHKKKQPGPILQAGGEEGAETEGMRKTDEGVGSRSSLSSNQHDPETGCVEGLPQEKDLLQTDMAGDEEEEWNIEEVARSPLSPRIAEHQLTKEITDLAGEEGGKNGEEVARTPLSPRTAGHQEHQLTKEVTDCAGEEEGGRRDEEVARTPLFPRTAEHQEQLTNGTPLSPRTAEHQEQLTNGTIGEKAEEKMPVGKKWVHRKTMNQIWREARRMMLSSLPPQLLATGSDRRSESQSRVATSSSTSAQKRQRTSVAKKSKPVSQNGDKSSSYQPCLCDFIMFKRLKIGQNYCPEPSNPITAFVRQINEDGTLKLEVIDGLDEFREPTGKFSIDAESKEDESLSSTVVLNVSELIDPRKVMYPPNE